MVIRIYVCMSICVYAQPFIKTLAGRDLCFQCFCFPLSVIFFLWGIYFAALSLTFSLAAPHSRACVAHLTQNPRSSHHSHRFIHLFLWSFTRRKFSWATLSEFITYTRKFQKHALRTRIGNYILSLRNSLYSIRCINISWIYFNMILSYLFKQYKKSKPIWLYRQKDVSLEQDFFLKFCFVWEYEMTMNMY